MSKELGRPEGPVRLDLGCGDKVEPGFIGVDICPNTDATIIWDLTRTPWPWDDSSVDEVLARHLFEHLTGEERITFMDELYRILRPGGTARIITPYWTSQRAIQDPTHKWPPVCEASYLYFNKEWREREKLSFYDIKCNFHYTYKYWHGSIDGGGDFKPFLLQHCVNVIDDLEVELTKI
jgi:SAM-dependent methyltransferase